MSESYSSRSYEPSHIVIGSNLGYSNRGGIDDLSLFGLSRANWQVKAGQLGLYSPYTDPNQLFVDWSIAPEYNSVAYEIPTPRNDWTSIEMTASERINPYINSGAKFELTYQQGYSHSFNSLTAPTITSILMSGAQANITFSDVNNYGADIKVHAVRFGDQFAGYAKSTSLGGNNYQMILHDISAETSDITIAAMKAKLPFTTGSYEQSPFSSPYQIIVSGDFIKNLYPWTQSYGSKAFIEGNFNLAGPYYNIQKSRSSVMIDLYGSSNIDSLVDQTNISFTGINSKLYKNKVKIHKVSPLALDNIVLSPTSKWSWTGVTQAHNINFPYDVDFPYPGASIGETGKFTPISFSTTLLVGKFEADFKIIGRHINAAAGGLTGPGLSFRGVPTYDIEDIKVNILSPYQIIRSEDIHGPIDRIGAFPGTPMHKWVTLSQEYIGGGLYAEENPPYIEDFYMAGKDVNIMQKLIDEAVKEEYFKSKEMLANSIRKSFLANPAKHLTDSTLSEALARIVSQLRAEAAANRDLAKHYNAKIFGNIYMEARMLLSPLPDSEFNYMLLDTNTKQTIAQGSAAAVILTSSNWTEYKIINPNYNVELVAD